MYKAAAAQITDVIKVFRGGFGFHADYVWVGIFGVPEVIVVVVVLAGFQEALILLVMEGGELFGGNILVVVALLELVDGVVEGGGVFIVGEFY